MHDAHKEAEKIHIQIVAEAKENDAVKIKPNNIKKRISI